MKTQSVILANKISPALGPWLAANKSMEGFHDALAGAIDLAMSEPVPMALFTADECQALLDYIDRLRSHLQLKKKHRKYSLSTKKRCWYCGDVLTKQSASIDHQTPLSHNGSNEKENKVLACKACNHLKDDMDVETYRYFLLDRLPRGERVIFFGERA